MMSALRAASKFVRALAHTLGGLATIRVGFPRMSQGQREARIQSWALQMLTLLGVQLELHGRPANGPVLLVANHISWLDILVMHAAGHCRFVSKADVRHWPLIGTLATGAGTLYIERESRRDAMRVVHRMAESLNRGEVVAIFPEGTTTDGMSLLPFHGNLLQAAISAGAPIQPVALSFLDRGTRAISVAPSYVGDETLVQSIWRTLAAPGITAVVQFGTPQDARGRDRRALARDLRGAISALREPCGQLSG